MVDCDVSNYPEGGFSLEVNQSYSHQVFDASEAAKVRSVYRRKIESHNLVIPGHWLQGRSQNFTIEEAEYSCFKCFKCYNGSQRGHKNKK